MDEPGTTGYCSPRCLNWDFFGVPALKQDLFAREVRQNQDRKTAPNGWSPPPAYPELGDDWQREITEALALLEHSCTLLRQDR
jgi:hypothetical protein